MELDTLWHKAVFAKLNVKLANDAQFKILYSFHMLLG